MFLICIYWKLITPVRDYSLAFGLENATSMKLGNESRSFPIDSRISYPPTPIFVTRPYSTHTRLFIPCGIISFSCVLRLEDPKERRFPPSVVASHSSMNWFSNSKSYLLWFLWVAIEKHNPPQLNLYLRCNPFAGMIIGLRVYLERSEPLKSTCMVTIERNNMWVQAHYCGPLFFWTWPMQAF